MIDWLFSAKGEWYRPNVQTAFDLNKKFDYLISHVRSYRDAKKKIDDTINIFDVYEK